MLQPSLASPPRLLLTLDAVGGVWQCVRGFAGALADAGMDCLLVGLGPRPVGARMAELAGLRGVTLTWLDEPLDWTVAREGELAGVGPALARLARDWNADIIHVSVPSQAAGLETAVPVVAHAHSCVATWWSRVRGGPLPVEWRWQKELTRRGLKRSDMVLAPSASHAQAVQAAYGAGLPVETLYNAAPLPHSCTEIRLPFVLAAGRWWDEGKNGHMLDAAAASSPLPVRIAGPLAGPGGQNASFAHLEHCGDLSSWQMQELMASAAVFAAPSLYEPFGLAVLEAAAQGCALVLSDIPTFRELWDGTALFAPADDPQAWAAAFGQLAQEPALLRHLGALARARARHFSLSRQTENLIRLYLKLAGALEEECA